MKKLLVITVLLLIPLLLLGCTADSTNTTIAEAAEPVIIERATEAPTESAENLPSADSPPKYCPVTQPPAEAFIPPEPFRQEPYPGQFFYGTNKLWTAITANQTWYALPYAEGKGYGQKLFFQREGYYWMDEPLPTLTVTGRKIDPETAEAQTMTVSAATNGYTPDDGSFMLVGADIPSLGCWEITGQYGDDTLTYVIWVAP